MKDGWNVVLRYDEAFDTVNMWLVKHNADGSEVVVQPIDLTMTVDLHPAELPPEPTIRFSGHESKQFLEELAGALVEAGFRPDELKASDKEKEAILRHLEDMRTLVMEALLPPEIPPQLPRR